ncbi:MAG TPA: IclR family transcriptional regulator [Bryobacteraceae bacterium]|nr:IclR family transcriptional regulator [Bryobacteraceae bacterium]
MTLVARVEKQIVETPKLTAPKPTSKVDQGNRYSIEAVAKALDILQVFLNLKKDSLSFTEIATSVGLNKNAVFRLLYTLTEKRFLQKASDSGKYSLSPKCIEMGRSARINNSLRRVALPHMQELRKRFEDTINFAVLEDGQICYVEVLESAHRFKLVASPGDRDPVHSTALGKAILAHLPEDQVRRIIKVRGTPAITSATITSYQALVQELENVRRRGYAVNEGEMVEGSRCVAVAILNSRWEVQGAISVSGPAVRIEEKNIPEIAYCLMKVCSEISRQLD